ncbi:hypothetical protein [Kingella oralis]|jgi:hypothetical protein|uniref:hypothetical protein n=1 Tax=Kingella oralis TaxID=505 RepID=UPI0034E5F544
MAISEKDFQAAAYFAIGLTSEGSLNGKERAYELTIAHQKGTNEAVRLVPIQNSGYAIGVIQTDFGQHPEVAKRMVHFFQDWAKAYRPDLRFDDKEVAPFIAQLSRTGNQVKLKYHNEPLNPKIKPAINAFLASPVGMAFVHAHDVKQINLLQELRFQRATKTALYQRSNDEDKLRLVVSLAKLANVKGLGGSKPIMEAVEENQFANFSDFHKWIEEKYPNQLRDVDNALKGLDVIFALEKAHPNNPLRQYWEKIKQDPLANPVHIKEPDRSHYKEIRELFVNPDVGLRRIQQHEKTQTHSFLQGKNEPTLAQRDLSAPARDGNSVMERLARLTEKNARLIEIYESGNEEAIRAANREIIENSPAVQKMIEGAKELATQEQQEQQAQQIAAMEMEAQQQSRGGRTR